MAKRFIDTGIFDDEWFGNLSSNGKLLWIYVLTKCDNAGIFKYNPKLTCFQTGIPAKSIDTVLIEIGKRLVRVSGEYIFCPKFIDFQYPGFPKSNAPQQIQVINILKKFGLWDDEKKQYRYSIDTPPIEYPYSYGSGKGNGNGDGEKGVQGEKQIEYEILKHPLVEKIQTDYPVLLKLKYPLTDNEAAKLEAEFGSELVTQKLMGMANRADLLRKYNSVNLTVRDWINLDRKKENQNGKSNPVKTHQLPPEDRIGPLSKTDAERFLAKGPIPKLG